MSVFKRVLRLRFGNFVGFGSPTKFFGILDFSWSQIFVNYFFSKLKFPGKKDKTVYPAVLFILILLFTLYFFEKKLSVLSDTMIFVIN